MERTTHNRGKRIGYALAPVAPLLPGLVLVAATARGVCAVLLGDEAVPLVEDLQRRFPAAGIVEDLSLTPRVRAVLRTLHPGSAAPAGATAVGAGLALDLDVTATAFQARVWAALTAIPRGQTRTYAQIAAQLSQPSAVRAVARACAGNPVALLVPCHRVLGSNGGLTGYRWGLHRKQALLALETPGLHGGLEGVLRNEFDVVPGAESPL